MKRLVLLIGFLFFNSLVIGQEVKIDGVVKLPIKVKNGKTLTKQSKLISLMNIKLSSHAKDVLMKRIHSAPKNNAIPNGTTLPSNVQLHMGNVPVLDQGNMVLVWYLQIPQPWMQF